MMHCHFSTLALGHLGFTNVACSNPDPLEGASHLLQYVYPDSVPSSPHHRRSTFTEQPGLIPIIIIIMKIDCSSLAILPL